MLEQPKVTLYQQQKATKPQIEDIIPVYLDGDFRKTAFEFAAYLRENKFLPRLSTDNTNTWKAMYKGKTICTVHFCGVWKKDAKWVIVPHLSQLQRYENLIIDEEMQNTIWDGIIICNGCPPSKGGRRSKNRPCIGGWNGIILGKDIKGICANIPLTRVWDPDEATLNGIKRLLELEKQARDEK